ncbi:MAG: phosphate ABC transporter, permease protein PstA [Desulfuromonas sp.]|nr:MAG: phosphate ABC transporter, permease protein PstA [Desulfuromonas sp.]
MKRAFWRIGEPMVWLSGTALSVTLLIALVLLVVIVSNGLGVFWPSNLVEVRLNDGSVLLGEMVRSEARPEGAGERVQYKIGNRQLNGLDFRWVNLDDIALTRLPADAVALERSEYGNFYGFFKEVDGGEIAPELQGTERSLLERLLAKMEDERAALIKQSEHLNDVSYAMEELRLKRVRYDYEVVAADDPQRLAVEKKEGALKERFHQLLEEQNRLSQVLQSATVTMTTIDGREKTLIAADVLRTWQPNIMTVGEKTLFYLGKLWELFSAEPRESNTEGGLFPAIFGTVMLIFVMSLFSFPFGVIAAVYLREYAKEGTVVRLVRIAVNNLAGIPSIVYGIFGLGFFVYGVGGAIDRIFYPELLPNPTFGTGGILWASLTLALLTVPVVIVATEEALSAIPREMREGSYALGATKFQTLIKVLLPMASPGIMTGLILAMARAAGEVAPLMITGVVKLAPVLPIDGNFPFVHLDRKFMHLGFHIFDIGFQSPNIEAAKPMVFVTTLLLVLIVLVMSGTAIALRNRMKKRYTFGVF